VNWTHVPRDETETFDEFNISSGPVLGVLLIRKLNSIDGGRHARQERGLAGGGDWRRRERKVLRGKRDDGVLGSGDDRRADKPEPPELSVGVRYVILDDAVSVNQEHLGSSL